jgi:hypothetical protein
MTHVRCLVGCEKTTGDGDDVMIQLIDIHFYDSLIEYYRFFIAKGVSSLHPAVCWRGCLQEMTGWLANETNQL